MEEHPMTCPFCGGAVPAETTVCPDCHEDLAALVRLERGPLIYYTQALALARDGHYNQAREKLRFGLELCETFAPAHLLLAKINAQQECWAEAQAHARRALELAPDDVKAQEVATALDELARNAEVARAKQEQEAAQSRRAGVESYWARYQRDMAWAFGLGVGLTMLLGLIGSALKGKKQG